MGGNDVQRSVGKIHLPQTLSEEPTGDELSDWEQVSFPAAERFVPPIPCCLQPPPPDPPSHFFNHPPHSQFETSQTLPHAPH